MTEQYDFWKYLFFALFGWTSFWTGIIFASFVKSKKEGGTSGYVGLRRVILFIGGFIFWPMYVGLEGMMRTKIANSVGDNKRYSVFKGIDYL